MNTPILLLIFNRPETTQQVFDVIKKARPKKLFIASDGPRSGIPGEIELIEKTKSIVLNDIDWDCEVKTLFRENNLGCGYAVSSAITWFFENVTEGIILEDDCLPDLTFFNFCSILLDKYKLNNEVMMISGNNFLFHDKPVEFSYYFSNFAHIWGWATWRRAWQKYDFEMKNWEKDKSHIFNKKFISKKQVNQLKRNLNLVYQKKIDTWDYQWLYTIIKSNGYIINPIVNLVINIGFGAGTHTTEYFPNWLMKHNLNSINDIIHPPIIEVNYKFDFDDFQNLNNISFLQKIFIKSLNVKKRILQNMQF